MFGYLIPRNYMEAMQFDSENKNSKWYDAIKLEMESMLDDTMQQGGGFASLPQLHNVRLTATGSEEKQ